MPLLCAVFGHHSSPFSLRWRRGGLRARCWICESAVVRRAGIWQQDLRGESGGAARHSPDATGTGR